MKAKLRERAETARNAPSELLDAMVEAAQGGATNLDIAKEIGFFYNPDVPESRECYDVIVRFFAERLGRK